MQSTHAVPAARTAVLLLTLGTPVLGGCASSPKAARLSPPKPSPIAAPPLPAYFGPKQKETVMALRARLRLGLSQRAVHRRIGRPSEAITTPLFNSGWYNETDRYLCSDGTLWVQYSDLPPTKEESTGRVTCFSGPDFTVGRCQ